MSLQHFTPKIVSYHGIGTNLDICCSFSKPLILPFLFQYGEPLNLDCIFKYLFWTSRNLVLLHTHWSCSNAVLAELQNRITSGSISLTCKGLIMASLFGFIHCTNPANLISSWLSAHQLGFSPTYLPVGNILFVVALFKTVYTYCIFVYYFLYCLQGSVMLHDGK